MHRIIKHCKLFSFCLLFLSLFSSVNISAGESIPTSPIIKGDIIYDIPEMDPISLTNNTEELRAVYIERQNLFSQQVDDKELNIGDALITIILPGGLFYAGYRQQELEQAKDDLLSITDEINELSDDLIAIHTQSTTHSLIIAQIP